VHRGCQVEGGWKRKAGGQMQNETWRLCPCRTQRSCQWFAVSCERGVCLCGA
jgi:hypothetical protein